MLISRIAARSDVVDQISAYHSVARLVDGGIGRRALETDDVDPDVVVVVDNVVRDAEVRDVPVHHQRLARTGLEVMHFIAVNDQVGDRSLWRRYRIRQCQIRCRRVPEHHGRQKSAQYDGRCSSAARYGSRIP